eukprot:7889308-Pyramimonas_sp.AAC.2
MRSSRHKPKRTSPRSRSVDSVHTHTHTGAHAPRGGGARPRGPSPFPPCPGGGRGGPRGGSCSRAPGAARAPPAPPAR